VGFILSSSMERYKSEIREVIKRFLDHRLSFSECIGAMNAALADLTPRLTGEQIGPLRALMSENNDIVMREMERRGPMPFDPSVLVALGEGVTVSDFRPGQVIFTQGDPGEAVFYIQKGRVRLTVVSKFGKQAVMGVLGAGSFLGEGCLRGRPHAVTATVTAKSSILRLNKASVTRLLDKDPASVVPKISFEVLAQMVGTTISRVSYFMKKFRKLGFIDYNGEMKINNSLLNVVLHDQFVIMANDPFPAAQLPRTTPRRRVKLKHA
jgi:CRP/FNR family transcriptional regulator, cyclic AMP receptor protein